MSLRIAQRRVRMRVKNLNLCALSTGIALVLLVGCGGSQPPVGALVDMPQGLAIVPNEIGGPCIYLLSTSEESDLSHTQITGPNCYVYINDTANMSYSTITAAKILYAAGTPNETGATFPEATPAPGAVVSDPCPTLSGCSYLTNHPPSTSNCHPDEHYTNATISPGCYDGLNLTGNDKLEPGLYVIDGSQFHVNNATVTGNGVTIYMTAATSDNNFSSAHLTLSAPTGGNYNGVLFYRVPSQTAAVDFSTCTCDFTGILYFPTAPVNYASADGNYQLLIFGQANFSTDGNLRFGSPYRIEAGSDSAR